MDNPNPILSALKAKGHKLTKVRKSLIEILVNNSHPLSVSELIEHLKLIRLTPNKTTLYREVAFLKELEILQEVEFGDGMKRYEISKTHHHHIVCIKCSKIEDIPMEQDLNAIEQNILKQMNFKPVGHSLEFFGICKECQ